MFGVPETIKLETVAAREAVNALNLTQKDLRHLKREFDEIDVDQSGAAAASESLHTPFIDFVCTRGGAGWSSFRF